jgi:dual-specificity kinase
MVAFEAGDMIEKEYSRKRRRLAWDVAPPEQPEADCEVRPRPVTCRHVSPPKREDDRDGHYIFNLGENLTPRYKILSKMGEG